MIKSNFTEFGRERAYFDFDNLHKLSKYHLQVASGYKTSIDIYGTKTLLCSELCHKLINVETVWDYMQRIYAESNRDGGYKERVMSFLVGQTVMTNYNNKTYRIDDINWDADPMSTFDKRGGGNISFIDYYFQHYSIKIHEKKQPLLVSQVRIKKRIGAPGSASASGPDEKQQILLIPELCVLTGEFNFFFNF